ncbi:MAG: winged helix-turn-helix transcriptional regulator [Planctomycetes bacterium]|nr:winged helix-turn-helix transcriptional regulator [Planctomycetota bacterium]
MERRLQYFKAFADPTRLRILYLLSHRGPAICVCDFVDVLDLPQSTISRQMAPLKMMGIVTARRVGTWVLYSLGTGEDEFERHLHECLGFCGTGGGQFTADLERFDELKANRALACCSEAWGQAPACACDPRRGQAETPAEKRAGRIRAEQES